MQNLAQTVSNSPFISLIQEQHTLKNGKPSGLDPQHQILYSRGNQSRAAIYAHKNVHLWFNNEMSSQDVATSLWLTGDPDTPRILLISCYWDIFLEKPPKEIEKAINYARRNNYSIIVGMDSNAHTSLTGSANTNTRGRQLEEFKLKHSLDIANRGCVPTFDSHLGKTIIDITLRSPDLTNKIERWKVHEQQNFSDHNTITFQTKTPEPETQLKRTIPN